MIVGITLYLLMLIISLVNLKFPSKVGRFILYIYMFLMSGLRYGVGTDFFNYLNTYADPNLIKHYNRFSYIFKLMYKIGDFLEFKYMFFVLTSLLFVILVRNLANVNRAYKNQIIFLVILSTMFFMSLNIIRQTLSILAFFNSLSYYVEKKDIKKTFVYFVLATLLHYSVLFVLPFVFISKKLSESKIDSVILSSLIISTSITVFLLKNKIITYVYNSNLPTIIKNEFHPSLVKVNLTYILEYLAYITIVFVLSMSKKMNRSNKGYFLLIFFMLGSIIRAGFPGLLGRLVLPMSLSIIIVIPILGESKNESFKEKVVYFSALIFLAVRFLTYIYFNVGDIFPYETWIF